MPKVDHRKNLTPTLVSGLKPAAEGTRYQVMDTQVPGFGIRVTDTGNRTFILRTRYPGSASPGRRERSASVPTSPFQTPARRPANGAPW
jgi:hypothetical protein